MYFLKASYKDGKIVFYICGSTKKVYEVTLNKNDFKIYCNCPDAISWCK